MPKTNRRTPFAFGVFYYVKHNNLPSLQKVVTEQKLAATHLNLHYPKYPHHTLLTMAMEKGFRKIILYLIKLGADVNITNLSKNTRRFILKTKHYCNINHTPLYLAIKLNHRDIIWTLLDFGAGINDEEHYLCYISYAINQNMLALAIIFMMMIREPVYLYCTRARTYLHRSCLIEHQQCILTSYTKDFYNCEWREVTNVDQIKILYQYARNTHQYLPHTLVSYALKYAHELVKPFIEDGLGTIEHTLVYFNNQNSYNYYYRPDYKYLLSAGRKLIRNHATYFACLCNDILYMMMSFL